MRGEKTTSNTQYLQEIKAQDSQILFDLNQDANARIREHVFDLRLLLPTIIVFINCLICLKYPKATLVCIALCLIIFISCAINLYLSKLKITVRNSKSRTVQKTKRAKYKDTKIEYLLMIIATALIAINTHIWYINSIDTDIKDITHTCTKQMYRHDSNTCSFYIKAKQYLKISPTSTFINAKVLQINDMKTYIDAKVFLKQARYSNNNKQNYKQIRKQEKLIEVNDYIKLQGQIKLDDKNNILIFQKGNIQVQKSQSYLTKLALTLRENIKNAIDYNRKYDGIILAMSIGDKNFLPENMNEYMVQTGTSHTMSISGMHLCIVSTVLSVALAQLGKRKSAIIILLVQIFFIVLVGATPPIIRSVIMASVGVIALISNNLKNTVQVFTITFMAMLFYDPKNAYNFSFILSTLATLTIVVFMKPIRKIVRLKLKHIFTKYHRYKKDKVSQTPNLKYADKLSKIILPLTMTALIQIICTPVLLLIQDYIPLCAVIVNFLISPLVALVTLMGLALTLVGNITPIGNICYMLASLSAFIIGSIIETVATNKILLVKWGSGIYQSIAFVALMVVIYTTVTLIKTCYKTIKCKNEDKWQLN